MSSFLRWVRNWVIVLIVFAVIDAGWIMAVVLPYYRSVLGAIMSPTIDPLAAGLFYVLFCAGLTYFGLASQLSVSKKAINGGLYGLFTYSTWALTLKVTIVDIPWLLVISDIAWGVFLGAAVTAIAASLIGILDKKRMQEEIR